MKIKQHGSVLLITMITMTSIFAITFTAATIISNNLIMGRSQLDSAKALYAAETGAERALKAARADYFDMSTCDVLNNSIYVDFSEQKCATVKTNYLLSDNLSSYYVIYNPHDSSTTFTSYGSSQSGVIRAIEVSY